MLIALVLTGTTAFLAHLSTRDPLTGAVAIGFILAGLVISVRELVTAKERDE